MGARATYRFPFASYPAVRMALLFAGGILIGKFSSLASEWWALILSVIAALFLLLNHLSVRSLNAFYYRLSIMLYLFLIVSFGGYWHGYHSTAYRSLTRQLLDSYTWQQIQVKGRIHSMKKSSSGRYQLDIESSEIIFNDSAVSASPARLRAVWNPEKTVLPRYPRLGDRLHFQATVYPLESRRNPYQFDYKNYLATRDIHTLTGIDSVLSISPSTKTYRWSNIRQATLDLIDQHFEPEARPLAKALLIGYKNDLDYSDKLAFSRAGLSHIMAVSGLHVGFLLAPFWVLIPYIWTYKYGRQIGLIFLIALLLFYAGLTGFSASVSRASITGGFILYARLFNKLRNMINLSAVAAVIILLIDPGELFKVGFQLSFAAVYIILLVMPAVNNALPATIRFRWPGKLLMIILISIVVQLGLYPLLSYYFGEFSLIGPLANAVVIPALTVVLPYALLLLLLSAACPFSVALLTLPAEWFLLRLNEFVTFTASREGVWANTHVDDPLIFAIWIAAVFALSSSQTPEYRWKMTALLLFLLCLQQMQGLTQKLGTATMEVTIFDVGQGDAALVSTPMGRHFLIDSGTWSPGYDSGRHIIIPHLKAMGISRLQAVFLSHPHADHIGGMKEIIKKMPVDTIYNSGYEYNSELYADYHQLAAINKVPVVPLRAGQQVALDPSMRIFVYGPDQWHAGRVPNDHSLILELVYGETEFLFMGDAGAEQESRLLHAYPSLLETDFIKVGHHGSRTGSSRAFLSRAAADWLIVSVAKDNRFGHPHPQAVQRLRQGSAEVRFTSMEKAMIFRSDGTSIKRRNW